MWLTPRDFFHVKPHLVRFHFGRRLRLKKQIDTLVALGKMKPNSYKYVCRVTLPVKKDGNHQSYGDYKPLNLQA
jgi:hypothetical protein